MSLDFSTDEIEYEGKTIRAGLLELENAVMALFWEGRAPRFGSLFVTLPGGSSSQLLGDRDALLGKLLGGRLANGLGKLTLVSINLSPGTAMSMGRATLELAGRLAGLEEKT